MTEAERLAMEMWGERAQGRASLERRPKPLATGLDCSSMLSGVKPVPHWAEARLNWCYKSLYKAKLKGDTAAMDRAEREILRVRERADLE